MMLDAPFFTNSIIRKYSFCLFICKPFPFSPGISNAPQRQVQQTPSVPQQQTQQTPSVPQQQTQQTPSVPQQQTQAAGTSRQFQGRTYDPNKMWSPQSNTGFRYEWNRGVFGISPNGTIIKEKLDGTSNHHADATVRISANLGFPIRSTNLPFAAAVESTNQGIVLFQSEGDNAFVYFPNTVNESQLDVLTMELLPRKDFNFSFTHNQSIFENQTYQDIIDFANSIPKKEAAVAAVR